MAHGKVRLGIVGGSFGLSFQWHLHPHCEVTAVCDQSPEALARLRDTYRASEGCSAYDELLARRDVDAIAVFTPAPLHAAMAIQAMETGKDVISAVPAGMTVEEMQALLDCVRRTGRKYMMAETSRYHAQVLWCREAAERGEFGTIFYSEAEYHHDGLIALYHDSQGRRTWRYGLPPMLYPTHCTGMILPVTGERLTEVQAVGWGDGHPVLRDNEYGNPFWSTNAFFKTSGGHCARISICWHIAAGSTERFSVYGDRMSFTMHRPEGSPNAVARIEQNGATHLDANGYPQGDVRVGPQELPDYFDRLPEPLRVNTGHGNSHTFLTHEFISAILEDRAPSVDVHEAIAYTLPGIIAHQSAMRGGEALKIPVLE